MINKNTVEKLDAHVFTSKTMRIVSTYLTQINEIPWRKWNWKLKIKVKSRTFYALFCYETSLFLSLKFDDIIIWCNINDIMFFC